MTASEGRQADAHRAAAETQMDLLLAIGPGMLRSGDTIAVGGDLLAALLTLLDPHCPLRPEDLGHPVIKRVSDRLGPHLLGSEAAAENR